MSNLVLIPSSRDEEFSVSSVLASDVIHASRKDIPCIFRVRPTQYLCYTLCSYNKAASNINLAI